MEAHVLEQARALSDRLVQLQTPIRILDAVNWPRQVREDFFKHKGTRLPEINRDYYQQRAPGFDTAELRHAIAELQRDIVRQLGQLSPIYAIDETRLPRIS